MDAIVAVDNNWGIGLNNKLLFRCKEDMEHFKELTKGKIVVMGRQTMLSLPNIEPLPDRKNLVLTTRLTYWRGFRVYPTFDSIVTELRAHNLNDVMIIGGSSIYELFLPYVNNVYVTRFNHTMRADRFFPNLDKSNDWKITQEVKATGTVNGVEDIKFRYLTYENTNKKILSI